jgi:hypothetical protein
MLKINTIICPQCNKPAGLDKQNNRIICPQCGIISIEPKDLFKRLLVQAAKSFRATWRERITREIEGKDVTRESLVDAMIVGLLDELLAAAGVQRLNALEKEAMLR